MPRSSGGGSHRGGSRSSSRRSHRSSFSSSSRRHYGSYSGGYGFYGGGDYGSASMPKVQRPVPVVRTAPFPDSFKFVRYRNNAPDIVYSNVNPPRMESSSEALIKFLSIILSVTFVVMVIWAGYHYPSRITAFYSNNIVIEDNINVLDNISGLRSRFDAFYDQTGVTPAVIAVDNNKWVGKYNSLENYAYDLYVNHFRDEYHWLIVYSQPVAVQDFVDWHYEGMQGDDTVSLIDNGVTSEFNKVLQRGLTDNRVSVSQAIVNALDAASDKLDTGTYLIKWALILVLLGLLTACSIVFSIRTVKNEKEKYKDFVRCPESGVEVRCHVCDGVYISGTVSVCPYCSARVQVPEPQNNTEKSSRKMDSPAGVADISALDADIFNSSDFTGTSNDYQFRESLSKTEF